MKKEQAEINFMINTLNAVFPNHNEYLKILLRKKIKKRLLNILKDQFFDVLKEQPPK